MNVFILSNLKHFDAEINILEPQTSKSKIKIKKKKIKNKKLFAYFFFEEIKLLRIFFLKDEESH